MEFTPSRMLHSAFQTAVDMSGRQLLMNPQTTKTRNPGISLTCLRWGVPFLLCMTSIAAALEPDQILLITNKNTPQGLKLAQLYAQKRNIPDHRILELNLPNSEEMPADAYDREVVPAVRAFVRENTLERKITCIVTFYGVPIRIGPHKNLPSDEVELGMLQIEQTQMPGKIEPLVVAIEQLATAGDESFKPQNGTTTDDQARRADAAMRHVALRITTASPAERDRFQNRAMELLEPVLGQMGMLERHLIEVANPLSKAAARPPTTRSTKNEAQIFAQFRASLVLLRDKKYDAESRKQLRDLVRRQLGPFEYARLLQGQIAYFQTENTIASFDSELSMLWWEYPKTGWMANTLYYPMAGIKSLPVMMVSRLDGPQPDTVTRIILDSLKAEAEGLKGKVVVDSRGLSGGKNGKPEPYGQYDQSLRNFADLVQNKTKLSSITDDRADVLPAGSANDVAVYAGWYSVDKYIPACQFHPGAVAFHLASFTMVTLKSDDPRCWVRGLLNDGAAATFGPVAEPYLQSFPRADDFFPLLLTGKLTLAEVYWKTTPMTSWMNALIGDPLYTPYKINPALAIEDLPERLQPLFKKTAVALPAASQGQ